jgi:nucleoside-diphosphate-sugar epimerase
VNLLTAKARIEGKITVFGGDQWRPFVHVDDAAQAVAMILEAPRELVANQVFNVGSNEQNYTITEIGRMVHQHVPTDKRNYRVSFDKIRNLLAFTPKWTVEQGIAQVLEAIASGEVQDYNDPRYSNVKFLTETGTASLARES